MHDSKTPMRAAPLSRLLAAGLSATCLLPAMAQEAAAAGAVDPVRTRLDARGIRYQVDADGDFKVTYSWRDEGRSQQVFVAGAPERAGTLSIRKVFAPVVETAAAGLDADTARALLEDNSRRLLGYWALDDGYLLYVVQVPDDIDAAGLETAIGFAAETADDKEIELTGGGDAL